MDPMEVLDELFEEEFQKFWTRGCYTHTRSEEWERAAFAAELEPVKKPSSCPHGKTLLTCNQCYFN